MRFAILSMCICTLLVFSGVMTFLYINVTEADPLVYDVQPFSLNAKTYKTSDVMVITSYRCNNEDGPLVVTTVERYFYNLETGERFDMPASPGVIQEGCSWQDAVVHNGFHTDMPSGRYVKRGVTEAHGQFKTVKVPWQTEAFTYNKE